MEKEGGDSTATIHLETRQQKAISAFPPAMENKLLLHGVAFIEEIQRVINSTVLSKTGYSIVFKEEDNPLSTILKGKLTYTVVRNDKDKEKDGNNTNSSTHERA